MNKYLQLNKLDSIHTRSIPALFRTESCNVSKHYKLRNRRKSCLMANIGTGLRSISSHLLENSFVVVRIQENISLRLSSQSNYPLSLISQFQDRHPREQ